MQRGRNSVQIVVEQVGVGRAAAGFGSGVVERGAVDCLTAGDTSGIKNVETALTTATMLWWVAMERAGSLTGARAAEPVKAVSGASSTGPMS
jgi:hypothetical protein